MCLKINRRKNKYIYSAKFHMPQCAHYNFFIEMPCVKICVKISKFSYQTILAFIYEFNVKNGN